MPLSRRTLLAAALSANPGVRLGCQTRSLGPPTRDRVALVHMLDDIATAGFAGVETNYIAMEADFAASGLAMREILHQRKLALIGLHMGVRFKAEGQAVASLPLVTRVADGVRKLGGEYVIVSGTASGDAAALKAKKAFVDQAGKICRDQGVRLLLHNHVEESQDDWAEYRALPHAQLLVDIGHPARVRNDAVKFLAAEKKRIRAIHVNDWQGETPTRLGAGDAQLEAAGEALKGWQGWAILELEGGKTAGGTPQELTRQGLEFMKNRMRF